MSAPSVDGETVVLSKRLFSTLAEAAMDRAADAHSIANSAGILAAVVSPEFQALLSPKLRRLMAADVRRLVRRVQAVRDVV